MDLPVFKLILSSENDEVDAVALVDEPAIEMNWMAFGKSRPEFFASDQEKRLISGPLMVAGLPIYRRQGNKEYYVVFDAETIREIVYRFFKNGYTDSVNKMHRPNDKASGVYMVESFIIDKAMGKSTPSAYGRDLPDGSWFGTYRVENDEIWNDFIKTGRFRGFSVEGYFTEKYICDTDQYVIETLKQIILNDA